MRRLAALLAAALLALALAACGEDDTETPASPPPAATPAPGGTDLRVVVTEAGEPQTLICGEGCDEAAMAKALAGADDAMRACTEIYGGPETAHVTGTLRGEPVDATITRNNGCGIADYEAVFDALGVGQPLAP